MRLLMIGIVMVLGMFLASCESGQRASSLLSAELLYDSFEQASNLARRRVRDANLDGCGYYYGGGGANYPVVTFEGILGSFVGTVDDAKAEGESLEKIHAALLTFVHDTDSIIELAYPQDAHYLLIEPHFSDWVRADLEFNSPADTSLVLLEATRILVLATNHLASGRKICGWGNDIPYVVLSPIPKSDSFSVRVGLRMPELCSGPSNYAIIFGDTLRYTSWAWVDGTFHRRKLRGVDTLTVKSCLGNAQTGISFCQEKWVLVGW